MKALIFYAKYGGGHLSAATALKEAIEITYPNVEIEVIDFMEYVNKILNTITTGTYNEMARKAPFVWGEVYNHSNKGPISRFSKTTNMVLAIKLKKLIKEINPDVIISAHPFSTQMCAFLKKHNKINMKIANVLTDFHSHDQWLVNYEYIDLFFVSNEDMRQKLIEHGIGKEKVFAYGIPISQRFLKEYDKEGAIKEFKLKDNTKTILFFAGGKYGLATKRVYDFIECFARDFKDIQVIAISGQNKKIYNKFNEIVEKYNAKENVKIIEFTDKVPALMNTADIVITKPGGITSSESMAMRESDNCSKSYTRSRRRECRILRKTWTCCIN